jgi:hypothetical protein
MPPFHRHTLLKQRNLSEENVGQALQSMGWQGDCHGNGVDDPSKDGFACRPICVALEHLFDRGGLITKDAVTWVHWVKT